MNLKISLLLALLLITATFVSSADDDDDDGSSDDDQGKEATSGTGTSAAARAKTMDKAIKTMATVMTRVLLLAAGPIVGHPFGIAVAVVAFFVDEAKKEETDLWKQLESKVTIKIGQQLAKYHTERLYAEVFYVLERRIKKGKKFSADDLAVIMDKKRMVFPHYYSSLGFKYDLPLPILFWMPFMISGYQKMIQDGNKHPCSLANELAKVRAEIIMTCKEMIRKRYREVHGTKYDSDRVNYPCRKRRSETEKKFGRLGIGGGRKTECVSIDRLMTYADGLSGKEFTVRKRNTGWVGGANWKANIKKVKDDTVEFLWKELVEKANNFFNDDIALKGDGCEVPKPIQKAEISFDWPSSCYCDKQCMHPCDRFGYSYDWCYIYRNPDRWIKTEPKDWDECMPVYTPTVDPPNVLNDEQRR